MNFQYETQDDDVTESTQGSGHVNLRGKVRRPPADAQGKSRVDRGGLGSEKRCSKNHDIQLGIGSPQASCRRQISQTCRDSRRQSPHSFAGKIGTQNKISPLGDTPYCNILTWGYNIARNVRAFTLTKGKQHG